LALTVLGSAAFLVLSVALSNWLGPQLAHYRVDERGVAVIRMRRFESLIPWDEIVAVTTTSLPEVLFDALLQNVRFTTWDNRLAWRLVLLERRSARTCTLTPRDPEGFAQSISERLLGSSGVGQPLGPPPSLDAKRGGN
jgi:hypothetical protein